MKKLLVMLALAASCAVRPAFAELTADLTFNLKESGRSTRLYAEVLLTGIADCPTNGSVTISFTSPDENIAESSNFEAPWRSCTKKSGVAHTRAYRTVGRTKGTWKVKVSSGKKVLAEGAYEIK